MRIVRRDFVRALGASGACASLPPPLWKSAPQDLRARLAADPLRPLDAQGQRILWGWIPETRPQAEFSAAGWAGCMALPRVLSLGSSGDVLMHTVPEVHALRAKSFIRQGPRAALSHIALSALDVKIENLCGEILWSTASSRCNFILEDRSGPWWSVESLPQGSSAARVTVNGISAELPWASHHHLEFHLFLDGSVAELICNHMHAFTVRIYRPPNGPLRFRPHDGPLSAFRSLQAWQLVPISPDRLTT